MKNKILLAMASALFMLGLMAVIPNYQSLPQAYAQSTPNSGPQGGLDDIGGAFPDGATKNKDVKEIAKQIIDWALYLSAIIAVIFIIYGGFLYITSAGDSTAAGKGKNTLVNAIIGLVIVIMSYMIVQVVYNFLVS